MSVTEIQKSVSDLSDKERAELALWILDSLPRTDEEDAGTESLKEALRRKAELDSGQVQTLSSAEFWDRISRERESEF